MRCSTARWALLLGLSAPLCGPCNGAARAEDGEQGALRGAEVVLRGLSGEELSRLAAQLGSEQPARRRAAFHALTSLHEESLPGVAERVAALSRRHPDDNAAREALMAFRHVQGKDRADDEVDLAAGVLEALEQSRDAARVAMAESVLLMRSLEHIGTHDAVRLLSELFVMHERGVWGNEPTLVRKRGGLRLLPAWIALRSDDNARIKSYAQSAVRALGMDDPADATTVEDPELLAQVIAAYAEPLDFQALPKVVRLVDHPTRSVRDAARTTVARFGKNAIWLLRELYQEIAAEPADRSWNAEQTANRLYALIDAEDEAAAGALLQTGMKQFVAGELTDMKQSFDELLARYPRFTQRAQLAEGYAALGESLLERDDLTGARDAFARALRLSPHAEQAAHWQAQLDFSQAEASLSAGVIDLGGYQRVLAREPEHAGAADAIDRLTGARTAREHRNRRIAAGLSIALLLTLLIMLLRGRRDPVAQAAETE